MRTHLAGCMKRIGIKMDGENYCRKCQVSIPKNQVYCRKCMEIQTSFDEIKGMDDRKLGYFDDNNLIKSQEDKQDDKRKKI